MKVFDIQNNHVVVEPQVLTVPEFRAIWDRDTSDTKENAFNELAFVYHTCDANSPYSNYPEDKKVECVVMDMIKDKNWKPDKLIKAASKKYKEMSETAKQRLVAAAKKKLDEIAKYFNDMPLTDDTVEMIEKLFKNVPNSIAALDKLEDSVDKDTQKENARVRGGREISMFER